MCVDLGFDTMTKEIQKVNAVLDFKVPFNPFRINQSININLWFKLLNGSHELEKCYTVDLLNHLSQDVAMFLVIVRSWSQHDNW